MDFVVLVYRLNRCCFESMIRRLAIVIIAAAFVLFAAVASHAGPGHPAGCPSRWCGCWARLQVDIHDTAFNLARHWLTLRHVSAQVGAWAVMPHHVGQVKGFDANGNPVLLSGNHGRVGIGLGTYPKGRVIAYVMP